MLSAFFLLKALFCVRHAIIFSQLINITIEKEVIDPEDSEMLEDLIIAATNKALEESQKMAQEEMNRVTSGMLPKIPGMGFPGM